MLLLKLASTTQQTCIGHMYSTLLDYFHFMQIFEIHFVLFAELHVSESQCKVAG